MVSVNIDVKVRMRDGVSLSTDIYRPPGQGPFPVLLLRTIYDNQEPVYIEWTRRFVEAGYAVVMQDCRGRFDSEGPWEPYVHEAEDGYDTQQWIGAQPWCDGNIGMFGVSYLGFTQTQPAPLRSPYVKGIVPIASQQDNFGHIYKNGALGLHASLFFGIIAGKTVHRSGFGLLDWDALYRRLPLVSALDDIVDVPFYREIIRHSTYDDFWSSYSLRDRYGEVDTPAYFMTGWYDVLLHDGFKQFLGWSGKARSEGTRRRTRIIVGPWTHYAFSSSELYGAIDHRGAGTIDFVAEHLRWFDQRLKGVDTGIDSEPPVRIFVMGDDVWRGENEWPLARTVYTRHYLGSAAGANSLFGDGTLTPDPSSSPGTDRYEYDPDRPVPTLGGTDNAPRLRGPARPPPGGAARRRAGLHVGGAGEGRRGDRTCGDDAVRLVERARHRLRRDTGGRLPGRPGDQHLRGVAARAVPGVDRGVDTDRAGAGLPLHDRHVGNEHRLQGRAPYPR